MVNIVVSCPECPFLERCPQKGVFKIAIDEPDIYAPGTYVVCPGKRRLYICDVHFRIVKIERPEANPYSHSSITIMTPGGKSGKWGKRALTEMAKRITAGEGVYRDIDRGTLLEQPIRRRIRRKDVSSYVYEPVDPDATLCDYCGNELPDGFEPVKGTWRGETLIFCCEDHRKGWVRQLMEGKVE